MTPQWTFRFALCLTAAFLVALLAPVGQATTDNDADGHTTPTDCDDNDHTVYPGATEIADGKDNDCDGMIDEGLGQVWYRDADGDGWGTASDTVTGTTAPMGYVGTSGDCNDGTAAVYPGAPELANGVDDDCDGLVDEGTSQDNDGDGFDSTVDCDDGNPSVHPGAPEWWDGLDNDCDGLVDNGDVDGDQVLDQVDNCAYTYNPDQFDFDGDQEGDACDWDDDNDWLADWDEYTWGTNPFDPDSDNDGLLDGFEAWTCMSPTSFDTDGDGIGDGDESTYQTDACHADTDRDGLDDGAEVFTHGTDPRHVDTDRDALTDAQEVLWFGTSPLLEDTDGDGLRDIIELFQAGTDPLVWDTDADGLGDGAEVLTHGTDPLDRDTDGDLFADGSEVAGASDPTNPWSIPAPTGPVTIPAPAPYQETPVVDDLEPLA